MATASSDLVLKHADVGQSDDKLTAAEREKIDKARQVEAAEHLARHPTLGFMRDLLSRLRDDKFPWWTAEFLLGQFSVEQRMEAYRQRPDIRSHIVNVIVGTKTVRARSWSLARQVEDLNGTLHDGLITLDDLDVVFEADDLVVYMDAGAFWHSFRKQMPWAVKNNEHNELVAMMIESLLKYRLLSHHDVRSAISGEVWQQYIPVELRIAVDKELLELEQTEPGRPFHAVDILRIVGIDKIAKHLPLTDLLGVMNAAEKAMGFTKPEEPPAIETAPRVSSDEDTRPTVPPPPQKEADQHLEIRVDDGDISLSEDGASSESDDEALAVPLPVALPPGTPTVDDGAFAAARPSESGLRAASDERHSSGGISASTIQKMVPLLEALEEAGFLFTQGLSLSFSTVTTLHSMLVQRKWPEDPGLLREAMQTFAKTFSGKPRLEIEAKSDLDLDALFFLTLNRMEGKADLVKALRQAKPKPKPPLKTSKAGLG